MAVFTTLFSYSAAQSNNAARLSSAAAVAQNAAEEFSSNPQAVAARRTVGEGMAKNGTDNFMVSCRVDEDKEDAGVLYVAHITVSDSAGVAYTLDASRYVSGVN